MKYLKTKYEMFKESMEVDENYLPTYEDCLEIVENNPGGVFYESKMEFDGYPVSMFNYRFAQFKEFENPIPTKPHINGYELRGITFVFNKDGSLYRRFLLLDKFFNLNQVPNTMYSVVKDYKVKNVMNKEDGSLASFIELPNGKIVGRSKMSFQSDQAIRIQHVYETHESIKKFVDLMMEKDIMPIFEYVASTNRIVLKYKNEDLILLRLRDNQTGKYHDLDEFEEYLDGINVANFENEHTLDDLVELTKTEIDKEGWVVAMIDDEGKDAMIKLKTEWYFSRHSLFTSLLDRENDIIKLILSEQIDDVMAQLEEGDRDKIEFIGYITDILNKYIARGISEVEKALEDYESFKDEMEGDEFTKETYARKSLALKYRRTEFFAVIMSASKSEESIHSLLAETILRKTNRLMDARTWLEKNK